MATHSIYSSPVEVTWSVVLQTVVESLEQKKKWRMIKRRAVPATFQRHSSGAAEITTEVSLDGTVRKTVYPMGQSEFGKWQRGTLRAF